MNKIFMTWSIVWFGGPPPKDECIAPVLSRLAMCLPPTRRSAYSVLISVNSVH